MTSSSIINALTITFPNSTRPLDRRHSKEEKRRVQKQMMESHVWLDVHCPYDEEGSTRRLLILAFCNCSGYAPSETVRMVSKVTKKLTQTQSTYSVIESDLPSLVEMVAMEIRNVSPRALEVPDDCCCYEKLKLFALIEALNQLKGHSEYEKGAHSGSVFSYDKLTDSYLDDNFILNNMDDIVIVD